MNQEDLAQEEQELQRETLQSMKYIDEKFIECKVESMCKRIMENIDSKISETVSREMIKDYSNIDVFGKSENNLIDFLEKEIEFLKREMETKNKIIEILLEQNSPQQSHKSLINDQNTEKFQQAKKTAKIKKHKPDNYNNYSNCQNRFEVLSENDFANDVDDKSYNDPVITQRKNITSRRKRQEQSETEKVNDNTQPKSNSTNQRKCVSILGDSLLKQVNGYQLSNQCNVKVHVKSFSGATTNDMMDYVKPTMKRKQDMVILHCGTNDLKITENNDMVAKNIIELGVNLSDETMVCISGLVMRNDDTRLSKRISEINLKLKEMCSERNIGFIDNENIDPNVHLNRSRLHLNRKGTALLCQNLQMIIKD